MGVDVDGVLEIAPRRGFIAERESDHPTVVVEERALDSRGERSFDGALQAAAFYFTFVYMETYIQDQLGFSAVAASTSTVISPPRK